MVSKLANFAGKTGFSKFTKSNLGNVENADEDLTGFFKKQQALISS